MASVLTVKIQIHGRKAVLTNPAALLDSRPLRGFVFE